MTPDDQELAARRAAVARMASVCPMFGRSLAGHGGTYAQSDAPDQAKGGVMNTGRPGVIPLGPIPQHILDELRHITRNASGYDWEWSHSGTETHEAALAYMSELLAHSDRTDVQLVVFEDDGGDTKCVAITGNDQDSGANARFMCAVQPVSVLRLLDEIARLKALVP